MWFTEGTWDAGDGYLLFYGGDNWAGTNLDQTWTYSAGAWTLQSTNGTPGPLDGPALAYDPVDGQVVMYGGLVSYSPFTFTTLTWTYSHGTWSSAQISPTPPGRLAGSLVFDPALGGVVLFGGYNNSVPSGTALLNDLWLYKGGTWSQLPATNPPPVRTWAQIAYDPDRQELVVFGGMNAAGACLGDTWTYTNGTWTHQTGPGITNPGSLCGSSTLYDPDLGEVLVTGGFSVAGSLVSNNTASWEFNGSAWVPLSPGGAPSPHIYGVNAWDPVSQTLVVAGGELTYFTTNVLSFPLRITNLIGPATAEVAQNVLFQVQAAGGVPQRTFGWSWGDGTVSNGSATALHSYSAFGYYTVSAQVKDALGHFVQATVVIGVAVGPAATITTAPAAGDVGMSLGFAGTVSGANGTVGFNWQFGDGLGATGPSVVHVYHSTGVFPIRLTVTDSVGGSAVAYSNVSIYPAITVAFNSSLLADAGRALHLGAVIGGGDPPLTYLWALPGGTSATTASVEFTFGSAGNQEVNLTVGDQAGGSQSAIVLVQVAGALGVTIHGPASLAEGDAGSWTATVSGGHAPVSLTWSLSDGTNLTGDNATHRFAATGTYTLRLTATDALGTTTNGTATVTVSTASASGGSTALGGSTVLWAVGGVLAAAAIGTVLLLRRRRSGRDLAPPAVE
ncbi:MAG: PKD domain-containing protein [Thermoplasmata archaeon]|nr:PKD domain-containing protein [Thermoplasmata archaeon]